MKHIVLMALLCASGTASAKYYVMRPVAGLPVPVVESTVDNGNATGGGTYDFGSVNTGEESAAKTVSVKYQGTGMVAIPADGISLSAGWAFVENRCAGAHLVFGANSCTMRVKFVPTQGQPYAGSLRVRLPGQSDIVYNLSGVGVSPFVSLNNVGTNYASSNTGSISQMFDNNDATSWDAFGSSGQNAGKRFSTPVNVKTLYVSANQPSHCWRVSVLRAADNQWVDIQQYCGAYSGNVDLGQHTYIKEVNLRSIYPYNDIGSFSVNTINIIGM